jgi:prolyl-tRNA synthetase
VDEQSRVLPVIMGSYGIGVGRLLACVVEEHHDEQGICWPAAMAPYPVHMVLMSGKTGAPNAAAEELYAKFVAAGLEPLLDDRTESAGVKFMDADLLGMPLRITVSERSLKQGGVEFKPRKTGEVTVVPLEEAVERAARMIQDL